MKKITKEDLIKKSEIPSKNSLIMHKFFRGKLQVMPRCQIKDYKDFGIWYSPGVAAPCMEINNDVEKVYDYTSKWNYVGIVSDCSRVLGLGNIGPEGGMPVMEGKALLFKYLGGVDAFPLCIGPDLSADEIINFVKIVQPTFGGINLEDIEKPKCFKVLDTLHSDPDIKIPVWHDDQQGTACVTLAGLINAVKIVGKKKQDLKIVFNGVGAANFAISRLLEKGGFNINKAIFIDSRGILYKERSDLQDFNNYKHEIAQRTNPEQINGDLSKALEGTDVLISLSIPGPDIIKKEWISKMMDNAIVFACANPVPEIFPWDALEAGAKIVATGRSDFPNQVNNSLGFPGIFRGTLDVRAAKITDEMCIAAANELANLTEVIYGTLKEDQILPTMEHKEIFINEAVAVGLKAIEQGIARVKLSKDELYTSAEKIINNSQTSTKLLMGKGLIQPFDDYIK